ncbi:CDP-archaeol synthase [Acidipila sp. EB88]|nr:CDP-archaeol synthase [Acidipila sp. EB88]
MQRVLTAAVLVPLVLAIVFWNSLPALTIAAAVVAGLATWEFLAIAAKHAAPAIPRVPVLCGVAVLFACAYFRPEYTSAAFGALAFILLAICAFRLPPPQVLPATAFSVFALVYTGWSLTTLPLISAQGNGPSLLVLLFLSVWTGDVAALYVGRNLGKHKLSRLSPNKTWEGAVASLVATVMVISLLLLLANELNRRGIEVLSYPGPALRTLLLATLLNIAAQLGDLLESAIKRGAGVKDSGTLLPGHGGVLDRIDALLLAAPVLWYALLAQQAL